MRTMHYIHSQYSNYQYHKNKIQVPRKAILIIMIKSSLSQRFRMHSLKIRDITMQLLGDENTEFLRSLTKERSKNDGFNKHIL